MKYLFLASLIAGLVQGVRVMLYGVERPRAFADESARSFRISPAVWTAAAIVFGIGGYVMLGAGAGPSESAFVAAVLASLASAGTVRLVKKWWVAPVEHDVDDPRYVLQGHLARVVTSIEAGRDGEVAFEIGNGRRVVRARGVAGEPLASGTEVVIERLEDDLAFVEAWAEVEKRL